MVCEVNWNMNDSGLSPVAKYLKVFARLSPLEIRALNVVVCLERNGHTFSINSWRETNYF